MSTVPVLMYHHVAPDREVTPSGFEAQLHMLKDSGYTAISGKELHAHITRKSPAPERAVCLTFDDGYADNWIYAYPMLKKYGMKAVIFAVTERLGDGDPRPCAQEGGELFDTRTAERNPGGFLRWSEAKAMVESGLIEIGSHTHTHRGFIRENPYEDLAGELEKSRGLIEERSGAWTGQLAWPWGDYEPEWLNLLPDRGYLLAHTTRPGPNVPGGDPLRVRRFKVQKDDLKWLKSRLAIYGQTWLACLYGGLYGLDRTVKSAFGGG